MTAGPLNNGSPARETQAVTNSAIQKSEKQVPFGMGKSMTALGNLSTAVEGRQQRVIRKGPTVQTSGKESTAMQNDNYYNTPQQPLMRRGTLG